jgi:hypothetical protein
MTAMVVAAIAMVVPMTASAQQWNVDIYGGWSYANLSGGSSALLGGQYKSGLAAGVSGELKLNEDWGWEFGLWYVQKGTQGTWKTADTGEDFLPQPTDTFDGTVYLDYVEVPILVNVYFPVAETANIRGFIGPAFAFRTRAEAKGDYNGTNTDLDMQDAFDDADITVMIGAGGVFELSRVNIMLDFRWDIGTTNISNVEGTNLRTNTVIVTLGVGIPAHKMEE